MVGQERGRERTGEEGWVAHEPAQERQVRRHALDGRHVQGVRELRDRTFAVGPVGDELRDHRVVGEPYSVALLGARVHANVGRKDQPREPSRLGEKGA